MNTTDERDTQAASTHSRDFGQIDENRESEGKIALSSPPREARNWSEV